MASARFVVNVVTSSRASGVRPGEGPGAVQDDDGLAGAGAAGEPEGAVVAALGVGALLGVQEDPPGAEVAALDDAAQLFAAGDVGEGELARPDGAGRGRAAPPRTSRPARARRRAQQAELVLHLRDRVA